MQLNLTLGPLELIEKQPEEFVKNRKHSKSQFYPVYVAIILSVSLSLSLFSPLCSAGRDAETMTVFASIQPQAFFIERIGGERVAVQAMVQPGHSPATYEPTPRQMADLSRARLYFRIGVAFENSFLRKISSTMDTLRIIDTRHGVPMRTMASHVHGEADHHHHWHPHSEHTAMTDPHIWLDPNRVKIQAQTIADALSQADPAGKETYSKNLAAFITELDDLDGKIRQILEPVTGRTFMVFHPSWGYFADAYGLRQEPIEFEGKDPSARHLAQIIDTARSENIKVIFVQPQFSRSKADAVAAAINGTVLTIDPLARNYIENLESAARAIRDALTTQKDQQ